MSADHFFKDVLKQLRPLFKENGFRLSNQNFILESTECWGIINFQRSRWSDASEKTFYINVAVTAKRLMNFDGEASDKTPAYYKCAWNVRAETLGPEPRIHQWTVRDKNTVVETVDYLQILLRDFIIPTVKVRVSESSMLEGWRDDTKLGYSQLRSKSVLLAARGRIAELHQTLDVFISTHGNDRAAASLRNHIERLRNQFPDAMKDIG